MTIKELIEIEESMYAILKKLDFQYLSTVHPIELTKTFKDKTYTISIYDNVSKVILDMNNNKTHESFKTKLLSFYEAVQYLKIELNTEIRKLKIDSLSK